MNEEQPQQPVKTPKRNTKPLIIALVTILIIAASSYAVYAYQQQKVTDLTSKAAKAQEASDKLQAKVTELEKSTPALTSITTIAVTKTEDETIIAAALADAEANVNVKGATAKIALKQGNFARVSVSLNPTGYAAVLKKVNGIWVVVVRGQEAPSKDDGAKYGLPSGWYSTEY